MPSRMRKKAGHCTQCGVLLYDTVWKHTEGPLKGEFGQFAGPNDNAWRVTFVLTDGNTTNQLFCEECLGSINLIKCWKATIEAFRFERDVVHPYNVAFKQVKPMSPEMHVTADKTMLHILHNPPIGILAKQRVKDIG